LFQGVSQLADMCVASHTTYKHTTSVDEFYDVMAAKNDTLEEIDSNKMSQIDGVFAFFQNAPATKKDET